MAFQSNSTTAPGSEPAVPEEVRTDAMLRRKLTRSVVLATPQQTSSSPDDIGAWTGTVGDVSWMIGGSDPACFRPRKPRRYLGRGQGQDYGMLAKNATSEGQFRDRGTQREPQQRCSWQAPIAELWHMETVQFCPAKKKYVNLCVARNPYMRPLNWLPTKLPRNISLHGLINFWMILPDR